MAADAKTDGALETERVALAEANLKRRCTVVLNHMLGQVVQALTRIMTKEQAFVFVRGVLYDFEVFLNEQEAKRERK